MKPVIHQNFLTPTNKIFCKRLDKVTDLNIDRCNTCPMCFGSLQGDGVECLWDDSDDKYPILSVYEPEKEAERVKSSTQIKKSVKIEFKK